jgi:transcriptional regulator with XRE-family HTH domain
MDMSKIGRLIYQLRKDKNMTQKQLADKMNISDKTISKWERGQGCPDISLLIELAKILNTNVESILSGEININESLGGNMNKLKFYVCNECNNLITSTGNANISCCGKVLEELEAKKENENHQIDIELVEDEIYVTSNHNMEKNHYISFLAYVKGDTVNIVKQYPEWNLQARFKKRGNGKLFYYCTQDGLFYKLIKR